MINACYVAHGQVAESKRNGPARLFTPGSIPGPGLQPMRKPGLSLCYCDLQWKFINNVVPTIGDDECMAEKNTKQPVRCNGFGLRHDHHAGPEPLLEFLGGDV